jgi:hypothetical protein
MRSELAHFDGASFCLSPCFRRSRLGIMTMLGAAIAGSSFARSSTAGGNF